MNPEEIKQEFTAFTQSLEKLRNENPERYTNLLDGLTEYYKALGAGISYLAESETAE